MPGIDPVRDVPETIRWENLTQSRYDDARATYRGSGGTYNYLPVTLEQEAASGGWLPGATPTGPMDSLDRLYTTSMRGEPGADDDPLPEDPPTNRYKKNNLSLDIAGGTGYD